ncbi:MAG: hypothetical protein IJF80_01630 [Clostridia bacterium]|nr:hypothetical protein [Clostridia bacterium]
MADSKFLKCIFCGTNVLTKWENLTDVLKNDRIAPYRRYECPNCGNYICADRPWIEAHGYNVDKLKDYLQKLKASNYGWIFFGEEYYYEKFKNKNPNILHIKPDEI